MLVGVHMILHVKIIAYYQHVVLVAQLTLLAVVQVVVSDVIQYVLLLHALLLVPDWPPVIFYIILNNILIDVKEEKIYVNVGRIWR